MIVTVGILFFLAAILAVLFWVWAVRGILAKIYKTQFGKKNVILMLLFGLFGWISALIGLGVVGFLFVNGGAGKAVEKSSEIVSVTRESAKDGWTKGLLKKLDTLDFEVDKVQEVEDELDLTGSAIRTFEATIIVNNAGNKKNISYKELRRANIAYALDENGVFIPAFIVNHSSLDEIPWLLRFFMPKYRKESELEFLPQGRSYLNVRFDVQEGHNIKSIGFGEKIIGISEDKILPLRKDDNFKVVANSMESEEKNESGKKQ